MKICIIGSSKTFFSGITTHTIFLANAFAEGGHEVSAVLLRNLVPRFLYPGRQRVGANDSALDFDQRVKVYNGLDWNSPASWFKAAGFLREHRPEAVIMLWWSSSVIHLQLFLALALKATGRPPLLLEMHEVLDPLEEKIAPLRLYSKAGGGLLKRLCSRFTVPSEEVRAAVMGAYGLPPDRVEVIPIGVYDWYAGTDREGARQELGLDKFIFLHFGMIRQYKGVPLLVRAFNQLPEEIAVNTRLVIAGEIWGDDPELEPAIKSSPYRSRIIYRPEFVPDQLIPKYFSAADAVVLPYLRTCGSGVVQIALAHGKPVITSDLTTMREYLDGYPGALFFPAGDEKALKDQLVACYQRRLNNDLKNCGHFGATWGDVAGRYQEIIEGMKAGHAHSTDNPQVLSSYWRR